MPPGESQLAYIWPFDEDWEKPRRSPSESPPHTCFDISLTGCSIHNHRLGGKTRNVMCLPIIGVMELCTFPHDRQFDIVSNVISGLLVKLLDSPRRPAPLSIDPPF